MSLFDRLKLEELNKVINDLPSFNKLKTNRNEFAHFCEHDGIFIHFTRARATWRAQAPCALKPWWLSLKLTRTDIKKPHNDLTK